MAGLEEPGTAAFQFGVFELNPHTRELQKRGVRLKIQDQPVQILVLLLERSGEIVTREEIQKRLWPDNTFVDFDNAINSAVRKLRDALGDSPENPRFIETLARRGYRFIAPVSRRLALPRQQTMPVNTGEQVVPGASRQGFRWAVAAAVSTAAVLAGIGLILWVGRNRDHQAPAAPVPFTSYPGLQLFPSFSPEGTRVAFSWGEPGKRPSNIYVKMIGPGQPVRLTSNPKDFAPAWSPDGRLIAFLRAIDDEHTAVMVTSALGGQERELARLEFSAAAMFLPDWEWAVPPPFVAWAADSKWVLAVDQRHIVRISAETGEKRSLTSPPPTIFGDASLAVSPDGKTLAFTRTTTYSVSDIYVVPVSKDLVPTSKPERITFDGKQITGLAWSSDGRTLVFPSMRGGRLELWRKQVDKPSSDPVRLGVAGDDPFDPAISREGRRLIYSHKFGYENIWRISLAGKQTGEGADLVPSTREEGHPRYSPDGKRIAFEASFTGSEEIWVADADGSNPVQLTSFGSSWAGSPRWSPDGRKIAFDCNAAGNWDVYLIDSHGGKPVRLTLDPALDARPSWSHDGQWIYFGSNRSGVDQIWKVRASGGHEIQVTRDGGFVGFESEDGQTLYYNRDGEARGMPLRGGNSFSLPVSIYKDNFDVGKRGVYFIDDNDAVLKLFAFDTHAIKRIASVPGPIGDEMSISPDERWMSYEKTVNSGSELMLVENFR